MEATASGRAASEGLFALAKEGAKTELVGRELGEAAATGEGVAELRDALAWPWIPVTVKRTVAKEVAAIGLLQAAERCSRSRS